MRSPVVPGQSFRDFPRAHSRAARPTHDESAGRLAAARGIGGAVFSQSAFFAQVPNNDHGVDAVASRRRLLFPLLAVLPWGCSYRSPAFSWERRRGEPKWAALPFSAFLRRSLEWNAALIARLLWNSHGRPVWAMRAESPVSPRGVDRRLRRNPAARQPTVVGALLAVAWARGTTDLVDPIGWFALAALTFAVGLGFRAER